jgi:hypothetical protein
MTAPIALFVYNRPEHTQRTLEALRNNYLAAESTIYIYCDGAKNECDQQKVDEVRKIAKGFSGFERIIINNNQSNLGLAKSVINGASEVLNKHKKIIVVEDDLVTHKSFLNYMNLALNKYQNNRQIYSVSGYSLPIKIPQRYHQEVYLTYRHSSWGWGTWLDRWQDIDWQIKDIDTFMQDSKLQKQFNEAGDDMTSLLISQVAGRIDSWSIRFDYHCFKKHGLCLAARENMVYNTGWDGTGRHCGKNKRLANELGENIFDWRLPEKLEMDDEINRRIKKLFKRSIWGKIKRLIKSFGGIMSYQ